MKMVSFVLALLLLTACNSAPKNSTGSSPNEEGGSGEKKTSFGRAVKSARDLNKNSAARTEEMEKQLHDATE